MMDKRPSDSIRSFLTFAGFHYWTASLLPALVGTTLPFWLRPPGFSFRLPAAIEFLFATLLFHAGFSFLLALFEGRATSTWQKPRLLKYAGVCMIAACLLGLHLNTGLTLHYGVPQSIFIIYGLAALFVGALYVIPPLNFYRRLGGEIVVAEGLSMIPVLGAYLVQVENRDCVLERVLVPRANSRFGKDRIYVTFRYRFDRLRIIPGRSTWKGRLACSTSAFWQVFVSQFC